MVTNQSLCSDVFFFSSGIFSLTLNDKDYVASLFLFFREFFVLFCNSSKLLQLKHFTKALIAFKAFHFTSHTGRSTGICFCN